MNKENKTEIVSRLVKDGHITLDEAFELMSAGKEPLKGNDIIFPETPWNGNRPLPTFYFKTQEIG